MGLLISKTVQTTIKGGEPVGHGPYGLGGKIRVEVHTWDMAWCDHHFVGVAGKAAVYGFPFCVEAG